ncbi:MAG: SDR family oxidoreductase, partial [Steroidobacteraceae bacterium]
MHNLSQRFPRKRAFITGAASGLGLSCAEILAREGWQLFLTDADSVRLELVTQSFTRDGASVASYVCDVRDADAIDSVVSAVCGQAGGIDLAIHCAGVAAAGPFHATTTDDWRWVLDINLLGVVNASRAVIQRMARGQGGIIINIASAASFCTGTQMSIYNTSKAAVVALSESLMQEYAEYGVHVVAAMPGFFQTRLMDSARGPERTLQAARRLIDTSNLAAEQVAEEMLWAAARGSTHFV